MHCVISGASGAGINPSWVPKDNWLNKGEKAQTRNPLFSLQLTESESLVIALWSMKSQAVSQLNKRQSFILPNI